MPSSTSIRFVKRSRRSTFDITPISVGGRALRVGLIAVDDVVGHHGPILVGDGIAHMFARSGYHCIVGKGVAKGVSKTPFVSSEGKVDDAWAPLIFAYGTLYGETLRESYVHLFVKREPKQALRFELVRRGWKEDEADSIMDAAQAAQDAAVESTTLALDSARRHLGEVDKKLMWAMAGDSKKRCRQRHGLARRRDRL